MCCISSNRRRARRPSWYRGRGGGIGLQLADRIRVNNWDESWFIIIMILVTVFAIDLLSKELRLRFIHGGRRMPV